jgi:hypothetical protein
VFLFWEAKFSLRFHPVSACTCCSEETEAVSPSRQLKRSFFQRIPNLFHNLALVLSCFLNEGKQMRTEFSITITVTADRWDNYSGSREFRKREEQPRGHSSGRPKQSVKHRLQYSSPAFSPVDRRCRTCGYLSNRNQLSGKSSPTKISESESIDRPLICP